MRYLTSLCAVYLLFASVSLSGAESEPVSAGRIKVTATILPLADIVRQVGGSRVQVVTLLPPGAAPNSYHLTQAQTRQIRGSSLIIRVGDGFDPWVAEFPGNALDKPLTLTVLEMVERAQGGARHQPTGQGDQWVWTDPLVVRDRILPAVRASLTRLHPGDARYFKVNERRYFEALTKLDQSMREVFQRLPGKGFFACHAVWGALAKRYGVQQAAIVEPPAGGDLPRQVLESLAESARKSGIVVVFGDPWSKASLARQLALQIQGSFMLLDPLGGERLPGRQSYLALMSYNMVLINNGIKQAEDAAD